MVYLEDILVHLEVHESACIFGQPEHAKQVLIILDITHDHLCPSFLDRVETNKYNILLRISPIQTRATCKAAVLSHVGCTATN